MQIGLDSNYYAELNNDRETVAEMRTRESLEAEEWERVRVSLLAGNVESGRTLNDRICDEFEWASEIENMLIGGVHVMDLYKKGFLDFSLGERIRLQASILASIIVGADHE